MSTYPDRYYTVSQLAEMWQCDSGVVYRYIASGKLPAFKAGVGYRISASAVAECEKKLIAEAQDRRRSKANDKYRV
jgi:excisionase family DNA binding protein